MHRYLLFFNYRGTNFMGSQKLLSRKSTEQLRDEKLLAEELKTVQGAIETGLNFAVRQGYICYFTTPYPPLW